MAGFYSVMDYKRRKMALSMSDHEQEKLDEALEESFPASDPISSLSESEPNMKKQIAVIIGSLRKGAFSRMTANALIKLAPESLELTIVEIGDLSLFNQDLEDDPPASWIAFRDQLRDKDGVIFVTPEYNRGVTAPMKNAVDIGSRPPKGSVWEGKPGTVLSTSPGALGGISANYHLRQTLGAVDILVMSQPNVSLGAVHKLFDENGELIDDGTKKYLSGFLETFAAWVEKVG